MKKVLFLIVVSFITQLLVISNSNATALSLTNTEQSLELDDGSEFTYQHFAAKKFTKPSSNTNTVALWILPSYPHQQRFYEFSQRLSDNGIEVWMVNILDDLFMPKGISSTRKLTGKYVAKLIKKMHQKTNKNVILIAESYSAIPVLRGAQQWQMSQPAKRYLTGAVLFSPNLFEAIPSLGMKPKFVDVAAYTNIPILLLQSEKSNTRGQLKQLLSNLEKNNASVFTSMLKNTIAIFYREDKTPETLQYLTTLPKKIATSLPLLESSPLPLFSKKINIKIKKTVPLDSELKKYKAKNQPLNINLKTVFGKQFKRSNYKGKITIVNFWATWCKPCLEEIPSLNRLKKIMKDKPFEIISINYAEKPEQIKQFMKTTKIDFPVLIDESGDQAVKWHVFAFPSTFVIAPDGKFHYGVNASIFWDSPEVISVLNDLY
ncbi:hypothetical protein MNBD_GAMMA22-1648 [hydrothermal vent metagenome]|uniref:Thioredoxin domain-containing protein n=1 Tax=hydrothermal vent metagenome TaxID=652676 RepID=A0A3B1ALR6_9ZZZZ